MLKKTVLLIFCIFFSTHSFSKMAPPSPPIKNPNPPVTEKDKARVQFGTQQIRTWLMRKIMKRHAKYQAIVNKYGIVTEIKHAHIIPWSMKKIKQSNKDKDVESLESEANIEMAPKLKADEYMIHSYVKFDKSNQRWYHLNVILTEDAQGNVYLRRFFITPMRNKPLPPGVKC